MEKLEIISQIIKSRRTIKPQQMDSEREVPKEILHQIMENANWAPTHGLTEPWRFKIFIGKSRKILAEKLMCTYLENTPENAFKQAKMDKLGRNPLLAPVIMAVCLHRDKSGNIPLVEEIESVACSVQNIHLTASAVGLGGFWSTPKILETNAIKEFLRLGNEDLCLGLFYIGWLKSNENMPKGNRTPVSGKIEWCDFVSD